MSDRFTRAREGLLDVVRRKGVKDLAVLRAVAEVPRHRFVPEGVTHRAYEDCALPIGFGQTISQPSLQALCAELAEVGEGDRVLEVGTGSGYQTALLARLADHVYSVERIPQLASRARAALEATGARNVLVTVGDGSLGWSRYAPYDAIIVSAASPEVPAALVEQLSMGGRLVVPVGDRDLQHLRVVRREPDGMSVTQEIACTFVPLLGRQGWNEGTRSGLGNGGGA
ncbi:MAG TPA: protein-L-isoaspartate(D-aspartate) O-methyltransferase [Longimicrobiales bacterium]|nr:protein-L-isoaspartate(D-aspartate) O-methyltransferase [Longimicrobiales bacterium]